MSPIAEQKSNRNPIYQKSQESHFTNAGILHCFLNFWYLVARKSKFSGFIV